ncbi:MAG: MFS transporter, partial [Chloroflexi bacterium]|nr:MFS transporter [Chloroflexota bacterium]
AYNPSYPLALLLSFGLGVGFMLQFTLINILLQTHVADDMRGRVLSLYTLTFFGFAPFGNLAMGTLAEGWGLSLTIGLSAAVAAALAVAVIWAVPRVRQMA